MRRLLPLLALLALPLPAAAQDTAEEERDRGFLTGLIEDNLSSTARQVVIEGFEGALSSRASVESLTIADAEGVWLRATDLVLDWDRSALFNGRIEVEELSAGTIEVIRAPVADPEAPSPEATPFALPALPVAVEIGALDARRIELGEALLGEALALTLQGSVSLEGGEGAANVQAEIVEGSTGSLRLDAAYSNETRVLALDLGLEEAPGGLAARALGLPGLPAVALSVAGTAPIDDYAATLSLATDGQQRIAGDFAIAALAPAGEGQDAARRFGLDVTGDVAPLVAPDLRGFFGSDVALRVEGTRGGDGALSLEALEVETEALALSGAAEITAGGWPARLRLEGTIGAGDGAPVPLPGAGGATVERVALDVAYDEAQGDAWTGAFEVTDLATAGARVASLSLTGGGTIVPATDAAPGAFAADLAYAATGLSFEDAGVADALGAEVSGEVSLARPPDGGPLRIEVLTVEGPGVEARAEGTVAGPGEGFRVDSTVDLDAEDLGRFAALAGLDLGGAAEVTIESAVRPLDGIFDLDLSGTTRDLAVGVAEIDPLLAGAGTLRLAGGRDEAGTRVEALTVATDALRLDAEADLTSAASRATFDLALADLGLSVPGLAGPARLQGTATRDAVGQVVLDARADLLGATLDVDAARAAPAEDGAAGPVTLSVAAEVGDLGAARPLLDRYAPDLGLAPAGAASVTVAGRVEGTGTDPAATFDLAVAARTQGLALGVARLDPLLGGAGRLDARLVRTGPVDLRVEGLDLATARVDLALDAALEGGAATGEVDLRVAEVADVLPGLSGPASLAGTATRTADGLVAVEADLAAPGTTATIDATVAPPGQGYEVEGTLAADVADLAPWSGLAGLPLSGALKATVTGRLRPDASRFDLQVEAATQDLDPGSAAAAQLLAGAGTVAGRVVRDAGGLRVDDLRAEFPNASVAADVAGEDEGGGRTATFEARLADIGLFAPDFAGPVTAAGTATLAEDGRYQIAADVAGPGGIAADVSGAVGGGAPADLRAAGTAPLALVNPLIAPRDLQGTAAFDLALAGPLAVSSLAGTVTVADARLGDARLGDALGSIGGTITLGGGTAQVDLAGALLNGGRLAVQGPVGLAAPFAADLAVTGEGLVIRDPTLYEATASGQVTIVGPLAGGARIAGAVDVAQAEIRVPSSGIGPLGDLPEVRHVDPPAAVAETLRRAGLTGSGAEAETAGRGPGYALDLLVRAPARVFVRGRGLDAELGGELRLTGSTDFVVPQGQFDLIRGRLDILGQRFTLTEGAATLQGEFVPFLRLVAETEARTGTVVSIILEGPATSPAVTFASSPELPQDEVLAQLLFGVDLESVSPLQAVQLASAVATLAGRGGGLLDDLREDASLADLDVTTDESGNAALRLGRYLGENVYTDVLVGTEDTEATINLDLTPDLSVRAGVTSQGETTLGIEFARDY